MINVRMETDSACREVVATGLMFKNSLSREYFLGYRYQYGGR
jgi:hypothetical protein